jgi:SynChlorMet cassette protein ScmC
LLVASGGTGKSTCCERLPDDWLPLSDDESLVVLKEAKKYQAHPFPTWSDYLFKRNKKTWNVQYSVPLSGIFFLEQAEDDHVESVGEGTAAVLMTESATQICEKFWRNLGQEDQKEHRTELFDNACEMAKNIPGYRLSVSKDGRFWEKMEEVIGS